MKNEDIKAAPDLICYVEKGGGSAFGIVIFLFIFFVVTALFSGCISTTTARQVGEIRMIEKRLEVVEKKLDIKRPVGFEGGFYIY